MPFCIIQDKGYACCCRGFFSSAAPLAGSKAKEAQKKAGNPYAPTDSAGGTPTDNQADESMVLPLRQVLHDPQHFAHVPQQLVIAQPGVLDSSKISTCLVMWLSPNAHDQLALLLFKHCFLLVWLCKQKAVSA